MRRAYSKKVGFKKETTEIMSIYKSRKCFVNSV